MFYNFMINVLGIWLWLESLKWRCDLFKRWEDQYATRRL